MRYVRNAFVGVTAAVLLLGFGLYGASRGIAQEATPVPPEGRPAHIHAGTCDTLDPNPLVPLTDVAAPEGTAAGPAEVTPVETSFSTAALDLATMLADDHSINVHLSAEEAAAGGEVEVSLSEFTIDMPTDLPAGPTTFAISNDGEFPHSFEIESEDLSVEEGLGENLAPGDSATLEVDLEPGTYEVYCPVGEGSHRQQGMELELTVE